MNNDSNNNNNDFMIIMGMLQVFMALAPTEAEAFTNYHTSMETLAPQWQSALYKRQKF